MNFKLTLLDNIKKFQEETISQDKDKLTGEEKGSQKDDKGIIRVSS